MSKQALALIAENKKTKAKTLDLGNCGLTAVPEEIGELVWLEELILSGRWSEWNGEKWERRTSQNKGSKNKITTLPPALSKLENLKILIFNDNLIAELSPLSGLSALQILYCPYTQVSDLSPLSGLSALQILYCSYTQVSDLSPLSGLSALQILFCDSTQVSDLSPLSGLSALQRLYCSSTQVSDLSPLSGLSALQRLFCNSTQVSDLSPLSGLSALQILYCDSTQVSDLSPLSGLSALQRLFCDSTQVSDLSPLSGLSALQILYCSDTQVGDLSPLLPIIKKGVAVKWQDFSEHFIENTENWEGRFAILVKDCPLINPPIEIVKQGNEAILRYFEDIEAQGDEIVYEAKMLVLGDAGAGKTTLICKIEDPNAAMPDEVADSTPGIAVKPLQLVAQEPSFTMHVWDFGGQEVYHATHQFFLTKRSLYVLLADGRKEEQLDYWLQMQEIYGQDSRLLLVVNQKGEMQPNLPMGDIRRDYPNVQDAQPTILNLKTDKEGAVRLRGRIENSIRNLPQFEQGVRTPKKWADIRRKLEKIAEDHISLTKFREICAEEGISDRLRQDDLLEFLHNLGAVLHFKEVEGLRQLVVLRPEWATQAVYRLLDHTRKKGKGGHFTRKDLEQVWNCPEYVDYFLELLRLMEKFELCYQTPEHQGLYVVPSLLPEDRPEGNDWQEDSHDLQLWYDYSFMPKGIVTRLIVRQHQLLDPSLTVWKRGALFTLDHARAEVTERFRDKKISIRASGKNAKALLTVLTRDIDALNRTFQFNERMALKQIVPCNCSGCKSALKPYTFEYARLLKRLENKREEVECEQSWQNISIPNLLRETFSDADKIMKDVQQKRGLDESSGRGASYRNGEAEINGWI